MNKFHPINRSHHPKSQLVSPDDLHKIEHEWELLISKTVRPYISDPLLAIRSGELAVNTYNLTHLNSQVTDDYIDLVTLNRFPVLSRLRTRTINNFIAISYQVY